MYDEFQTCHLQFHICSVQQELPPMILHKKGGVGGLKTYFSYKQHLGFKNNPGIPQWLNVEVFHVLECLLIFFILYYFHF